jgi:hypothetical protein
MQIIKLGKEPENYISDINITIRADEFHNFQRMVTRAINTWQDVPESIEHLAEEIGIRFKEVAFLPQRSK